MHRRTFFGLSAAAGITACSKRGGGAYWRFFSDQEARTVNAMCAQLIPADDYPGASEAHVVNYIDIQLSRKFRRFQQTYRRGIADVDSTSQRLFSKPFADLATEQQTAILQDTEKNSRDFFELILAHTRQGFYGDPRHGGNYQMASWKMIKLPFPQVRGRQHYEE